MGKNSKEINYYLERKSSFYSVIDDFDSQLNGFDFSISENYNAPWKITKPK